MKKPSRKDLKDRRCNRCKGRGTIVMHKGSEEFEMVCPACKDGKGYATK